MSKCSDRPECPGCNDTGWTGDQHPGKGGRNEEVSPCDCKAGRRHEYRCKVCGKDLAPLAVTLKAHVHEVELMHMRCAHGALFVAAPELLAACKAALEELGDHWHDLPVKVQLRAAIAKAEGAG